MPFFSVHRSTGTRLGRMRRRPSDCQVFHSSYYRTSRSRGVRNVSTVHDLAYELGFVGRGMRASLHRLEHRRAFFTSDALICVSAKFRDDLLRVYPSLATRCEVFVIPHGVSLPEVAAGTTPAQSTARPISCWLAAAVRTRTSSTRWRHSRRRGSLARASTWYVPAKSSRPTKRIESPGSVLGGRRRRRRRCGSARISPAVRRGLPPPLSIALRGIRHAAARSHGPWLPGRRR